MLNWSRSACCIPYASPSHERRVLAILRDVLGEAVFITCSSDILPIIREYERTSTTVINAYRRNPEKYFESPSGIWRRSASRLLCTS